MRRIALAGLLGIASVPATRMLPAQGPQLFEVYAARKELSTNPVFGGLALSGYHGIFGIRLGGGLHLGSYDADGFVSKPGVIRCDGYQCWQQESYAYERHSATGVNGWTLDADLLVAPFRSSPVMKGLLLGFSPYAFIGIGGNGGRSTDGLSDTTVATVGYGGGVYHEMLGWLGVSAEARKRRSLGSDSAIAIGSRRDWEYRVGLTVSFGSTPKRRVAPQVITVRTVSPPPRPADVRVEYSDLMARRASRVLDAAEDNLGARYRSGGRSPYTGFDASGFVEYTFDKAGISLPRGASRLSASGIEVPRREPLRSGDLLFFANDGYHVDHVAIYAGRDRIIHASASAGYVRYDVLGEGERGRWFADHLISARRVVGDSPLRLWRRSDSRDDDAFERPDRAPRPFRERE